MMEESTNRQENFFNNIVQSGGGVLLAGNSINTGGGDVIFGRTLRHTLVDRYLCLGPSADYARDKKPKVHP
jgi:hypothetical protein